MKIFGLACLAMSLGLSVSARADSLDYLRTELAKINPGGWGKVSTTPFSSAWPTGPGAVPDGSGNVASVAYAWTGFAWDSQRSNLLLFGGGHANYPGNEVYVWQGSSGAWTRGSLPSKIDSSTNWVVGNGAPQSAHTYESNIYAPLNDRFVVFGGAAWNGGGNLSGPQGETGPWWWDPAKADPNQVGGATGSGWNSETVGSNSWQARTDSWLSPNNTNPLVGPKLVNSTAAYTEEAGKDVVYLTMDQNASGRPVLYRYELGSPTTRDSWSAVGRMFNQTPTTTQISTVAGQGGAASIDSNRGLFVRTTFSGGNASFADLAVWDLANNRVDNNPHLNMSTGVRLVLPGGGEFDMAVIPRNIPNVANTEVAAALDYDALNDQFVIWDGRAGGTVWTTRPEYDASGKLKTEWTVFEGLSTSLAQPAGLHGDGVLGKWEYIEELGAFIAMDSYNFAAQDAGIWLYKPLTAVPEVPTPLMLAAGLGLLAWMRKRKMQPV